LPLLQHGHAAVDLETLPLTLDAASQAMNAAMPMVPTNTFYPRIFPPMLLKSPSAYGQKINR